MDNYRRRPPMEGFSRPGSLGGEAHDDDSVEGHMMDDERIQEGGQSGFRATDDDTEGHGVLKRADEDDTEGHGVLKRADEDDTEGHGVLKRADEDDVEGHGVLKRAEGRHGGPRRPQACRRGRR